MWYKRFGYKAPDASYAGGMGCFSMFFVFVFSVVLSFVIAVFMQNGWFLFTIIPISLAGFYLAEKYADNEGARIRRNRYDYHIKRALEYIKKGSTSDALESIRKAKIYGELSKELQDYEYRNKELC